LITVIATTAAADITGVVMAGAVAVLGLFVIPAKRRQAKSEMKQKVGELRTQLAKALRGQFEREIERSLQRINEAISPYTRFVRAERSKLQENETELQELQDRMDRLKVRVEEF
jgi:ABC-type transport system involved in cytochrome bd biosynthesis fused ATPase/permease subunit